MTLAELVPGEETSMIYICTQHLVSYRLDSSNEKCTLPRQELHTVDQFSSVPYNYSLANILYPTISQLGAINNDK